MLISANAAPSCRFSSAEPVPVQLSCNIHSWMKAWVVIRPNPYACASTSSGEFVMPNVPYGTWEFQFWHEKLGYIEEMSLDGVVKELPKGRMNVEVGPGGVDLGTIVLHYPKDFTGQAEPGVGADSRWRPAVW
jgi:hypothetical protein